MTMRQNYQTCVPNQPIERENGYNIKVDIKSKDGSPMSDLGFECEFWLDGSGRKVVIGKFDMAEIMFKEKPAEYFAQMYGSELGGDGGWLFCTVAIQQPDVNWPCGYRDVTIEKVFTGIYLGHCCGRMPRAPRHCCNGSQWHNGFKVSFEKVDYLPKSDIIEDGGNDTPSEEPNDKPNEKPVEGFEMYYGVIRGLTAFNAITPSQLAGLTKLSSKPAAMVNVGVTAGDTLVVLTKGAVVKKDDGVGGKVDFATTVMGANGESVTIDGVNYKAYGETFIVSGNVGFYIV